MDGQPTVFHITSVGQCIGKKEISRTQVGAEFVTFHRDHIRPTLGQRLSPLVEECEALLAEMRRITSPEDLTDEQIDETLLESRGTRGDETIPVDDPDT